MKTLLAPVVWLMQRLRLLPKFALVTMVFVAPLALVGSLLFAELNHSIAVTAQERIGVRYVQDLEDLVRAVEQHRELRHMQLAGNAQAAGQAKQARIAVERRLASLSSPGGDGARFGSAAALAGIGRDWKAIEAGAATASAKASYAVHSALLERVTGLIALVADKSGMTLDPEPDSYHLTDALVQTFPSIAESISLIAGRGAAYIDTGLLEPNEDLLMHSTIMVGRRDLGRVPAQFDAVFRENAALRQRLQPTLASLQQALAFLDRAQNEVVNAYNQTSGNSFYAAGAASIDALHASATACAQALDRLLQKRLARDTLRRNLIAAAVLAALAIAVWLLAGFYASFAREVAKLEQAVRRAAGGDLGYQVQSDARDEIGNLVNAFGAMNAGLAKLVQEVRAGSATITDAAQGIAASSADLSARTEAQASSLQQTAGSMEELTSTVHQNGLHAGDANRLALSAEEVARKGGRAVGQVIATMGEIKGSSDRISDIIRVIDGISFQTNLLALNAAVEAAHAGEHGRGFAVVAAEVRALAQRSAAAAREVKTLIENSVAQIETGNRLAGAAGATMDEIVASVQQVAGIMNDITAASQEQSAGIAQVNQAIGQMDEVTQRNAIMVDQAAQAANALRAEADRLAHAVAAFKLDQDDGTVPAQASITPLPRHRSHHEALPGVAAADSAAPVPLYA